MINVCGWEMRLFQGHDEELEISWGYDSFYRRKMIIGVLSEQN